MRKKKEKLKGQDWFLILFYLSLFALILSGITLMVTGIIHPERLVWKGLRV
jgi:hypothetical protein